MTKDFPDLSTKAARLAFGDEGELKFLDLLLQNGINAKHLVVGKNQTSALQNLKEGDIEIEYDNKTIRIDVKYGIFISFASANYFNGDYFALFLDREKPEIYLVTPAVIKSYMKKVPGITLSSGARGHLFRTPLRAFIPFDKFVEDLKDKRLRL